MSAVPGATGEAGGAGGAAHGGRRSGRRRRAGALALAVVLAVGIAACGDDEDPSSPEAGEEVEGRAPTSTAAPDAGGSTTSTPDTATDAAPSTTTTDPADAPGPLAEVAVAFEPLVELEAPTKLVGRTGSDLLYVAEQVGRVVVVDPAAPATDDVALDLTDVTAAGGEQGLLGLAFSPDGATLYVHHSGTDGATRIAAFTMDGDVADPDSRVDLLTVEQPFANHNGGDIVVGPDGMLWIGLGDGGAADDPDERAQDPDDLLGKVLRIDPTAPADGEAYGIPQPTMFADGEGRPEIAVSGVRNPWRLRFDEATGDLWIADVGQNRLEEITRLPAGEIVGANLGWSRFEGSEEHLPGHALGPGRVVGPVFETSHEDGWCSISGGVVYRGTEVADLAGAYLFGDFCKPGLSAIRLDAEGAVAETAVLDNALSSVVSVDADLDGEVYVLSIDGTVSRLVAA